MTEPASGGPLDLRQAPLEEVRSIRFRSASRDVWTDEAALWSRLLVDLEGLDEVAWRTPISASDAGGPDWTLLDHVAHLAAWQEEAERYVGRALAGKGWPRDEDYGDFAAFNEGLRLTWADLGPADVRSRLLASHERLLALAKRLDPAVLHGDGWEWVFFGLHGHQLDHLGAIEPALGGLGRTAQAAVAAPSSGPRP